MRLAIIINTYENPVALNAVLGLLCGAPEPAEELIVADDGSGDATREVIAAWTKNAPMPVRHAWQEHQGFRRARALNLAIAATSCDYLVFLDGDCLPSPRFAAEHRALAEPGFFVQGRRCFVAESCVPDLLAGRVSLIGLALRGKIGGLFKSVQWPWPVIRRDQDLHGILGCNLAIWREDLVAVNGYDETYEGWGKEDSDLAARLYHLGRRRKLVHGRAILYHLNHPAASRAQLPDAELRLQQTLDTKKIRCEKGLDQYSSHLPS